MTPQKIKTDPGDEGECKCSEEGQGPKTAGLSDIWELYANNVDRWAPNIDGAKLTFQDIEKIAKIIFSWLFPNDDASLYPKYIQLQR